MKDPLNTLHSIRLRFLMIAILTFLIVIVFGIGIYYVAEANAQTLIAHEDVHHIKHKVSEIELTTELLFSRLKLIANSPEIIRALANTNNTSDNNHIPTRFSKLSEPRFVDIEIARIDGTNIRTGKNISNEPWFQKSKTDGTYLEAPIFSKKTMTENLDIALLITNGTTTLGIIKGSVNIEDFNKQLLANENPKAYSFMTIFAGGAPISSDPTLSEVYNEYHEQMSEESGFFIIKNDGQHALSYSKTYNTGEEIMGVFLNKNIDELPFLTNLKYSLIALCFAVFLGIIFALYRFDTAFVRPVKKLSQLAHQLSEGETVKPITKGRNDELHELEDEIRWMSTVFQKTEEYIKDLQVKQHEELQKTLNKKTHELQSLVENLKRSRVATLNIMEDLQDANTELETKDQVKTDFLNMISHELKTPLTPIKANLDMLIDKDFGAVNNKQLKALNTLMRNIIRLEGIIKNLLEISRIEAGRIVLDKQKTELNAFITDILEEFELPCKEKGLTLSFKQGKIPQINCDQERVKECLLNFLNNSLKFTEKGSITVTTKRVAEEKKTYVEVSVIDTGKGVNPENIKNLFQKFYQEGKIEVGKAKGVGLGLYSVRRIIEIHDGTVGMEPLKQGSRFWFRLPK